MVLYVLFYSLAVYYLLVLDKAMSMPARRFDTLAVAGITAYLVFLSFSQPSYRYLFANIILAMVFLAVCADLFITATGNYVYYITVAGILLIGAYAFYTNEWNNETDLKLFMP